MTHSSERFGRRTVLLATAMVLVACSGDGTPTTIVPRIAQCNGAEVTVRALAPMEMAVITGAEASCIALAGGGRDYLIAPQLTGASLPYGGYSFRFGDPAGSTVARVESRSSITLHASGGAAGERVSAQDRLEGRMRASEQVRPSASMRHAARGASLRAVPVLPDTLRTFSALTTLDATPAYRPVTAQLRYSGSQVLIYMDTLTRTALTDAEISAMGRTYDTDMMPAVTTAFGTGSDIDGNGRVIFLLTPAVNALVSNASCSTSGFVRGYFYSYDLNSAEATSNRGEIFYAYVPDAAGRFSCAHTKQDVLSNLPPTFVHELQHMISYGEHAVKRNGPAEEVWLNEGLSHLAEELGSRVYEARFPAPAGRTAASQLFPDSSAQYITPNVLYSYRYLFSSGVYSLTACAPGTFCSLSERGGTWLFLRWIADRSDAQLTRRLVETTRTGRENLEAATGRSTAALLGEFALAAVADSVVGVPRTQVPSALRFSSRNLRVLYRQLFETLGIVSGVSRPYPIEPTPMIPGGSLTATMRPGTFLSYRLTIPAGTPSAVLRLSAVDGTPFPVASGAQVSVLRLP